MDVQTIKNRALLQRMRGNLEKIYQDGDVSELTNESQYLLESIETFEDLYAFLEYQEEISQWSSVDLFGFFLCLIEPEPGFDPHSTLSDRYLRALEHIKKENIDYGHPEL